jgi:hypothetical protein
MLPDVNWIKVLAGLIRFVLVISLIGVTIAPFWLIHRANKKSDK